MLGSIGGRNRGIKRFQQCFEGKAVYMLGDVTGGEFFLKSMNIIKQDWHDNTLVT